MLYAIRNTQGEIESLSRDPLPEAEALDAQHPDVLRFLGSAPTESDFSAADADFVRVLEDLIDTLILKNVIRHTDLPAAAQKKLLLRKGLRNRMQGALNLLGDDSRLL